MRNPQIPFSVKTNVSRSGVILEEEGFYVPDISTLHIACSCSQSSFLVKARMGKSSGWETIASNGNNLRLDISPWIYIRIEVILPQGSQGEYEINVLGYQSRIQDSIISLPDSIASRHNIENNNMLKLIYEELIKLNQQISIITGEENDN